MDVVREMALILSDRPNSPTGKAIRLRVGLPGCHVVREAEATRADGPTATGRRRGGRQDVRRAQGGFNVINPP